MSSTPTLRSLPDTPQLCLALSGGNALGAYSAGAFEALDCAGLRFDMICGASIGGVTATLIAGSRPEARVDTLRAFWSQASSGGWSAAWSGLGGRRPRELANAAHALHALSFGRPGLFRPRVSGFMSLLPGAPPDVALFDPAPMVSTLERLVDFDYLHDEGPQLILCAVDLESGEPVYFDSRRERITPLHLLATTAFLPSFPPVEIDGRLLVDPGLVCNLPLDPLLKPQAQDRLCFAVDLFSGVGGRPYSIDTSLERAQDIIFSAQTARTIDGFRREHRLRHLLARRRDQAPADETTPDEPAVGRVDLVLAAYRALPHELAAKMLEFSGTSLLERWDAGRRDMTAAIDRLARRCPDVEDLGFALYRGDSGTPDEEAPASVEPLAATSAASRSEDHAAH